MAPSSDNEGAPRNGTAGRESLRDLPEHENIVEHFYDPEDQGSRENPSVKNAFLPDRQSHLPADHSHSGRYCLAGLLLLVPAENGRPARLPPKGKRPGYPQNPETGHQQGRLRLVLGRRHQPLPGFLHPSPAARRPGHLRHQPGGWHPSARRQGTAGRNHRGRIHGNHHRTLYGHPLPPDDFPVPDALPIPGPAQLHGGADPLRILQ